MNLENQVQDSKQEERLLKQVKLVIQIKRHQTVPQTPQMKATDLDVDLVAL